ncbi:hypothetical protein AUJ84_02310 [Candidatus Pacearchaeota archaeon CG1_02_32_132]|nr:MAG: hypothetical protein AUJ84_02310 [Candidatus Pacearchaeota archaeon CG1_02_32_132]
MNRLEKELRHYTLAEKILFLFNVFIAILIILFSGNLLQTTFGKSTLALGLVMVALITILRVLKKWGPKNY